MKNIQPLIYDQNQVYQNYVNSCKPLEISETENAWYTNNLISTLSMTPANIKKQRDTEALVVMFGEHIATLLLSNEPYPLND